jgi:hypothetical protein
MRKEDEIISEETLKFLTAAVLLGFLISDAILIEGGRIITLSIMIPLQLTMLVFHRKRLMEMLRHFASLIIQPYEMMFKMLYKIFTGRTYGKDKWNTKTEPTKPIDPKVNGRWEIPVTLSEESEAKLNRFMKYYELDYEPEIEKQVKPKAKAVPESKKYVFNGEEYNTLEDIALAARRRGSDTRAEMRNRYGVTVANHLSHNFMQPETTQTLKSNNSKIVVDNAKVKGNNNRITGNNNVIKGNNLRVKGNNNVVNGNNVYVDGKNNRVTGNNATVINRGGSQILGGNNGKLKDF